MSVLVFYLFTLFQRLNGQQLNLQLVCGWVDEAKNCLNPATQPKNLSELDSCPTIYNGYYCIPQTPYKELAKVQCPFYVLQLIEDYRIDQFENYNFGKPAEQQIDWKNNKELYGIYDWPTHYFHGYHHVNEEFKNEMHTTQPCNDDPDYGYKWGKFDRNPCNETAKKHHGRYVENVMESNCKNQMDCSISKYSFNSGTTTLQNRTIDSGKETQIQLLQYARMVLISGYAISLVATCLGSFIMILLRRLRCTRIYIHINLQISFMLRAAIWLSHDIYGKLDSSTTNESTMPQTENMLKYFAARNKTAYNETLTDNESFTFIFEHIVSNYVNPQKKLFVQDYAEIVAIQQTFCTDTSMGSFLCRGYEMAGHYITCSNYFWFLVEGIYLKLLLQRASFRSMSNIKYYLAFGWGFSLIPTLIWATVNLIVKPNDKCWLNADDFAVSGPRSFAKVNSFELITEVPIMISVLINVFIFISVVSIVGSKLRVTLKKSDFRYRLLRANLALIPLLGIHYAMTMFVPFIVPEESGTLLTVVNFINSILLSLQGLFVSIIYCFCNAEVQDELEKSYSAWKLGKDVRDDANRRRSTLSNSQSGTWWPGQGRRRSSMMTGRTSFSVAHRRSTEQTYVPSESVVTALNNTGTRNISTGQPGGTSTMRKAQAKIQNMLRLKNDENNIVHANGSSLLAVPNNQYEDAPRMPTSSTFKAMTGIQEEPVSVEIPENVSPPSEPEETDGLLANQRREGVLVMRPITNLNETNNNDSGFDEKD